MLHLTGKDKASQRRAAFNKAAVAARANTIKTAVDPETARKVLGLLDGKIDKRAAEVLGEEGAKLLLFADRPDLDRLSRVCQRTVGFEAIVSGEETLPAATIAPVLADYLDNLREALLDQEAYADLVQKDMRGVLREILTELRPVDYDDERIYRQQMAEMHSRLDFVGIPELKERRPITVDDVFIGLRFEWTVESSVGESLWEAPIEELEPTTPTHSASGSAWTEEIEESINRVREDLARRVIALQVWTREFMADQKLPEVIQYTKKLLILGEPGAGKTTLLKYLAVICAEGRAEEELGLTAEGGGTPLPVFIPLREFAAECATRDGDYNLLDYLYTYAREHLMLNLPRNFFEEALAAGRCLVCLDGLDEVWAVDRRKAITDAVRALANRYRDNRYLVTSRIVGYNDAPLDRRDFAHCTVLPLKDADIEEFIRKWYTARERDVMHRAEQIKDLLGTLEREPRIRDLARNPLLLTIIALVHRIEAELPHERVKLYDKCVTALVDTWDEVKGLTISEKQRPFFRERRRLLERLAYELQAGAEGPGQLRTIKAGDLEFLLTRFLMENRRLGFADDPDAARDEAAAFVRLARGRTGLLVERGEGVFGFPHLTFQEYLAACDIEHRCMAYGVNAVWHEIAVKHSLHDPHWREVILLLLGSLNRYEDAPTLLVERIMETGEADPFEPVLHRHLHLAARALADRVQVAADLRHRIVDGAIAIARERPWWERQDAIESLSHLTTIPYAAEQLLALARDDEVNNEVRRAAVNALGRLGRADEATLATLLALARDPQVDDWVHRAAAQAIGQLGFIAESVPILMDLARNPSIVTAVNAYNAVETLAEFARTDESIFPELLVLASDSSVFPMARSKAISALGQSQSASDCIPTGLQLLVRDLNLDTRLRRAAALSLAQLGCADKVALLLLELDDDPKFADGFQNIRAKNLDRLGLSDGDIAADLLVLGCLEQVSSSVRCSAAQALGRLGRADEATSILLALTNDTLVSAHIRSTAAQALGRLGRVDEAAKVLLVLACDALASAGVRRAAVAALGQLGRADEATLSGLLALARDPEVNSEVRGAAAKALGQLGQTDEAVKLLLGLARDPQVDAVVHLTATSALGKLGRADDALVTGLFSLVNDPEIDVDARSAAAQILGEQGFVDEVSSTLLVLARDPRLGTEIGSPTYVLGQFGKADQTIVIGLLALARDEQVTVDVRRDAYESLKRLLAG